MATPVVTGALALAKKQISGTAEGEELKEIIAEAVRKSPRVEQLLDIKDCRHERM